MKQGKLLQCSQRSSAARPRARFAAGGHRPIAHAIAAAAAAALSTSAFAQAATATAALASPAQTEANAGAIVQVTVSARNREELAQDVPIPISVIGGETLDRQELTTVTDFTRKAANLLVNAPNARQTSIAIRGLGKNSANDSMEPSVGVIVDNVIAGHVGMSWANFVDVDRIEIERGPQGTLLGKNTTLGVLNIVTKAPSFTPRADVELLTGDRNAIGGKAAVTGPIVDNLLAWRGSLYVEKRDGTLKNIFQSGEAWGETNRIGARLQFLLTPSPELSARIILDQSQSDERINIQPYAIDPPTLADGSTRGTTYTSRLARTYFGGYQPIFGSADRIDTNDARPLLTNQHGVSVQIDKTLGDDVLTSITAWKDLDFDAKNDGDQTHFSIGRNGTLLHAHQVSQEFRFTSPVSTTLDYQVGLFALREVASSTSRSLYGEDAGAFYATNAQYATLAASAPGGLLLRDALKGEFVTTETTPTTTSLAAFGQANWHLTDKATLTLGLRDTDERKDNSSNKIVATPGVALTPDRYPGASDAELAAASATRASQEGTVYGLVQGVALHQNSISWLVNPSYRVDPTLLLYASAGYGEKSGAVQFDSKGNPANVRPEKALDFEAGFKSTLFSHRLMLNMDIYQTTVRDYQSQLQIVDPDSSTGYSTALSNVARVRARGIEGDAIWVPLAGLTLTGAGAFNDAKFVSFANATCPTEQNTSVPCDYSGKRLPYAPRFTLDAGAAWKGAVGGGWVGDAFVNNAWRSASNVESTLSVYGGQPAYSLTDLGVGVARADDRYGVSLVAKNVFDKVYATSISNFSNSAGVGYTYGDRRTVSLIFRARI